MNTTQKLQDNKVSVVKARTEGERDVGFQIPRVAVSERKDAVVLQMEMSGVPADGLELSIEKDRLIVIGHVSEASEGLEAVYRNRDLSDYRRIFSLGRGIDYDNISASLENDGMLIITLPKVTLEIGKSVVVRT